jgi:hypothetical protein
MKNGRHLGENASSSAPATVGLPYEVRSTLLILGFGLSAALMFVTIYPRQRR